MHFTSHSGRVWAIVLLDKAEMNPDFIKSQLCWMGDMYMLHLQDTAVLQTKHATALKQLSNDLMMLLGKIRTSLPNIVPEDNSMGSY
jgi:hypothetical protein